MLRNELKCAKEQAFRAPADRADRDADREDHVLGLSLWKIIVIGGIIALLFGKGKISGLMGDMAQGIKAFKKGMNEDDSPKTLDQKSAETVASAREKATG